MGFRQKLRTNRLLGAVFWACVGILFVAYSAWQAGKDLQVIVLASLVGGLIMGTAGALAPEIYRHADKSMPPRIQRKRPK